MKKNKTSLNLKKVIAIILITLIFIGTVFFAGTQYATHKENTKINSTLIKNELKSVKELITTEYSYSKVGKYENSLDLNGWQIPLSQKSFLLTYTGNIKLGVDLDKAKIAIQGDTININLPPISITENTIDEESIEIYDESNNLFNPIKIEDYKNFAIQQKEEAQQDAIDKGLYQQAQQKTVEAITSLINIIQEEYTVNITFEEE